eukprot:700614-Lingulodinium_polyedra.AAC.1
MLPSSTNSTMSPNSNRLRQRTPGGSRPRGLGDPMASRPAGPHGAGDGQDVPPELAVARLHADIFSKERALVFHDCPKLGRMLGIVVPRVQERPG